MIGLGTDLCDVERIRRALARTTGFKARVFTPAEQEYCDRARDPAERYAARFAAKEAVLKAMGAGLGACKLREIEVARADGGSPSVVLHGGAAALAASLGITSWHISLSHTAGAAHAIVAAE